MPAATRSSTVTGGLGAALAALVVLAPWLRPGALLVRDLVAVPDPAFSAALLGGADRLPRDVPGEVLAAAAGQLVGGAVVVRVALAIALVALGAGVGRLLGRPGVPALVAGFAAVWNPWVLGRLHQGQWLVVVALAALPWVVVHLVADERRHLARSLVVAGATGFVGPLVVGPSLLAVGVASRRWRVLAEGVGVLVLLSLPWLVVAGPVVADPDGVRAFAPSADLALGVVPSLLTGGGYFNLGVASPWREQPAVAVLALLLFLAAAVGVTAWVLDGASSTPRARTALVGVTAALLLVVAATATETGRAVAVAVLEVAPPVAALRDGHRLLAPLVVLLAVGVGRTTALVLDAAASRSSSWLVAVTATVLVVVALPDPVLGPGLPPPSDLPTAWERAAAEVAAEPSAVLVVPHGQTQRYAFTGNRPVAMPLRRLVAAPVLVDTQLVVASDDGPLVVDDRPGGRTARRLAAEWPDVDAADLRAAGVGWVAVTDPGRGVPAGVAIVVDDPSLRLVRLDGDLPPPPAGPRPWVLALDGLVALAAVWLVGRASVRRTDVPI